MLIPASNFVCADKHIAENEMIRVRSTDFHSQERTLFFMIPDLDFQKFGLRNNAARYQNILRIVKIQHIDAERKITSVL